MLVAKWGNSLAVRLPKALVERLGLKPGDELAVVATEDRLIAVEKRDRGQAALSRMAARDWPEGRFSREDANER
ncbi:MAG: AbrB/MazE/SpoVT family DNA-binding domain-containing protein [Zavarzinia sp.]|nr:AbrB/MazE/SpoVT family DNA-binding domain-containing protein [Zavarzinia sp.]